MLATETKIQTFDDLLEKYGRDMHRLATSEELQAVRPNGLRAYFQALRSFEAKQNAPVE